jgi:tetratricopeptide (TPR) repeat protein
MRRALAIDEASYGLEHPNVATSLNNLAQLLQATNRLAEAEPLMRRVLLIFLGFLRQGVQHPHLQAAIGNHAALLQEMGYSEEAIQTKLKALVTEAIGVDI